MGKNRWISKDYLAQIWLAKIKQIDSNAYSEQRVGFELKVNQIKYIGFLFNYKFIRLFSATKIDTLKKNCIISDYQESTKNP